MRENGAIKKVYGGDTAAAKMYTSMARTQLGILKNLMSFQNLQQLFRTVTLQNGVVISVRSIFGQDAVDIYVPPGSKAVGEKPAIVSAIIHGVDYVAMSMPNPVPYRGVAIGVASNYSTTLTTEVLPPPVNALGLQGYAQRNTLHVYAGSVEVESYSGTLVYNFTTTGLGVNFVYTNWPGGPWYAGHPHHPSPGYYANGVYDTTGVPIDTIDTVVITPIGGYLSAVPDQDRTNTTVMASDGEILASEVQNTVDEQVQYVPNTVWNGDAYVDMYVNSVTPPINHQLTFTVPEDCIYPIPPASPVPTVFNTRRKAWLKKNSDEVIAALKTGFAPGAEGVTRAELQTGKLPSAWDFQIKRDVDTKYNSYTPTYTIGRKTKREIMYSEAAYSETVESDTSADLTQAGVKVTKRVVTLQYTFEDEVHETNITGYLTQIVTRHNDTNGSQLDLSRQDVYANWYNRESTTLPSGVPSTIPAPYLKDRTTSRIGVVLNGTVQNGYNADSTLGTVGNPLTYVFYVPPYPKASSTVTATVPAWIEEWHRDSKIVYLKDGAGASNTLNDSAMYGVVEVNITPIGVFTEESLGIFPDADAAGDATQVEMFGTAVYSFDWQTGAFTFKSWQPLRDENDVELASKIYSLPTGFVWSDSPNNCLVTYKWANDTKGVTTQWPDVAAALLRRNSTMQDDDSVLYSLIQAKKAG